MVPYLPLNFLIFLKEFLTSMVYINVEVMVCSGIYGVSVKAGVETSIPHLLTLPNGL